MSNLMKGKYETEFTLKEKNPFIVLNRFIDIVNKTHATVINTNYHIFPNNALSAVILIMESHVAIHTWPEIDKAWVGFYTCSKNHIEQIRVFSVLINEWSKEN